MPCSSDPQTLMAASSGGFALGRLLRGAGLLAAVALMAVWAVLPARADSGDYAVEGGRLFTQAAESDVPDAGFAVTDADGIPVWTEFQRLGGVQALGYPLSRRFVWDGFTVQVFQKVVLQWRPESNTFMFVNVFDRLNLEGYDDTLEELLVPPSEYFDEEGFTWDQIIATRQALLNANPALRDVYFAVDDPLRWYGLPTSHVITYEHVHTIRLQRAVLQQWLTDLPWASAGEVTVANGGDLARGAGTFPADVLVPEIPRRRRRAAAHACAHTRTHGRAIAANGRAGTGKQPSCRLGAASAYRQPRTHAGGATPRRLLHHQPWRPELRRAAHPGARLPRLHGAQHGRALPRQRGPTGLG